MTETQRAPVRWNTTLSRIAFDASRLSPAKVLLTVVTVPFYLFGLIVGVVWMCMALMWAAVAVGVDAGRRVQSQAQE